ncbi:MAG TPA: PKD domain-containing protein [Acidimicrobiales bacterium]|nr:PKD domain-containing protein [Acidimicrobiales bacterium]
MVVGAALSSDGESAAPPEPTPPPVVGDSDPEVDPADGWLVVLDGTATVLGDQLVFSVGSMRDTIVVASERPDRRLFNIDVGTLLHRWDETFDGGPATAALMWDHSTGFFAANIELTRPRFERGSLRFDFQPAATTMWIDLQLRASEPPIPESISAARLLIDAATFAPFRQPHICELDVRPRFDEITAEIVGGGVPSATTIDWGDGTTTVLAAGERTATHTFEVPAGETRTFTVSASGGCDSSEPIYVAGPPLGGEPQRGAP